MQDVCEERAAAGRLGRWVAPATVVVGTASLVTGVTTSPRSGPFCSENCIGYPYTDAAGYVPQDYLWMYPGVLLTLLFVVLTMCLVAWVVLPHRLFAAIAACFGAIGAAAIVVDYGIQLTFVQPALLAGETQDLVAWTQYNPHGVFIALENVGYALIAVAFLFLGVAMASGTSRLERAVRWIFAIGGVLVLAGLLVSAVIFRGELDYRFEVLSLSVVWLVLISSGALLSVVFRRGVPSLGRLS
jgi:hypothetical protein